MDALADSDADEAEFHQEYYDNSSSDDDFNSDRASDDEDGGRSRGRQSVMGGGRIPQPADRGDNVVVDNDDGWTRTFVPSHIDLSFNEDEDEVVPVNILGAINDVF
ncbi:hypothetical protein ElyMa_001279900 [Elysia marginata]|uniref:Uncharacterized protein n=1 Tax=Elysia marginata TaxID=1093978 RepID=A0AAV4IDW7_9GAST|nr:hypothetical protein ElyMa_001279900 [Elysia marginata]